MLLRNLSLVLGVATASAAGTVVTVQNHQNHLNVVAKAETPELACKQNTQKDFYPVDTLDGILRDIYIVNGLTAPRYNISTAQHKANIKSFMNYCKIDDMSILQRVGKVVTNNEKETDSSFVVTKETRYKNNSNETESWSIPEQTFKSEQSSSWQIKPLEPSKAKISFLWGEKIVNADLRLPRTLTGNTNSITEDTDPAFAMPVAPHTQLIRQERTKTIKKTAIGGIVYTIDLDANNGFLPLNLLDRGPRYCSTKFPTFVNVRSSIEKIIARDKNAFSKSSNGMFIYEDKKLVYNIPMTWNSIMHDSYAEIMSEPLK